ncbi:cytochrome c oxidase polypeptide VIb [Phakopsora pachyrhizi]|nr:cytochrome c oxidase polypeptide VIb [Phakopsora pachyrhizi]
MSSENQTASNQSEEATQNTFILQTAGFDARFPNTNQTKHCSQSYIDYHMCKNARGEDFAPCKQFFRAFHSLCPSKSYKSRTLLHTKKNKKKKK